MKGERKSGTMLMTEGVIWKQLLLFSLPLLVGNLFQQLYNTVDYHCSRQFYRQPGAGGGRFQQSVNQPDYRNVYGNRHRGRRDYIPVLWGQGIEQKLSWAVHTCIALSLIGGVFLVCWVVLCPLTFWMDGDTG